MLVQHFGAGIGLQPDLRKQRSLTLAKLCLGRPPICRGLSDTGMGFNRLVDCIEN